MNVRIIVNTSVDFYDDDAGDPAKGDPLEERMRGAALDAVAAALEHACNRGFHHDMDEIAGVCIQSVSFAPDDTPDEDTRQPWDDPTRAELDEWGKALLRDEA